MRQDGFTLVEVVASFVIIGMSMLAILNMFAFNSKVSVYKEDRFIASNLLQRKLEEVRYRLFSDLVNETGATYPGFPGYTLDVLQATGWESNPSLKRIRVTVNWNTPSGVALNESAYILVAKE